MKAALIGLGMVSRIYGDSFRNSKTVSLASVFARSSKSRREFLNKWPDLGAVEAENLKELAEDPEIDFAILTTPPNARAEIVETLLAAGKPILMEKPVERTLTAAVMLVERCESKAVPLGIVLQHRARPSVAELRRLMPTLGDLITVEINVPWWRPQAYYDEPGRGTYSRDGGGVLISQAIHTIDLALSLTGPVESVTAMSATTGFHSMESEDFVVAGLRFKNGAVGQLFASTASYPGRTESIRLNHREGSAQLEAGKLRIERQDGGFEQYGEDTASGAGSDPMAFTSDWHRLVIEEFAEAVRTGGPPPISGRAALEVHRLITALEGSARTGQTTSLTDI
ncbi:MAG: Gfo/Idh/MocA family oxidoreductase [Rhodobacteraceae bacterium]|nr:Gfo/Idh/MocA family oxidoreductase [Paracoccaceae bacterium]